MTGGDIAVGVYEAIGIRIVILALQIVKTEVGVVIVAAVAEIVFIRPCVCSAVVIACSAFAPRVVAEILTVFLKNAKRPLKGRFI